jgi:Carboxypeptidase regulatory-like domain
MVRRALLVVVMLVAGTRIADACVCEPTPVCQRFWTADVVFTGVVTDVTWSDDKNQRSIRTTMAVERGLRGASGQVVLTAAFTSCTYNFVVGQRYLVYARRNADGTLTTGECSGNKLLADADDDLDYAEHLPPPGSGGRIFGRVRRFEADLLDRRNSQDVYPAGLTITLRDWSGATKELRTDAQGAFEAVGLKPGTYSLALDAPATARVYSHPPTLDVRDRACAPASVTYQSNGRVAGRIVDADGLPVSKVPVSAFPRAFTTKKDYPDASIETRRTDADGHFEIGPLPPGEYHVGVNVEWPAGLDSPYPPTYFPGVLARAQAETIALGEGEMRRADFVLPRTLTRLAVSGAVVFPDGTPAPNVAVHLVAGTASGIATTRTDASGSFTLTGLSGSTYSLRASFYASRDDNGSAEATVSVADAPVAGVKLVLIKR